MADEPSLPELPPPAVSWDQGTQRITNGRKRVRLHRNTEPPPSLASNSSDPAFFSSDDDPSLESYSNGRRKRRLKGSWYEQQPVSSDPPLAEEIVNTKPKTNRKFARYFDSGVWMAEGSDEPQADDDLLPDTARFPPTSKLPQLRRQVPQISDGERVARERIKACVEEGNDTIDLADLGLETISNETIAPLSNLSYIPIVEEDVPFETHEQELKIFLANNWLKSLPGALFNLGNITTLSLRQTGLRELPDAIEALKKLRDLNLMGNKLRYLPSSLLNLLGTGGALTQLRCGNCRFLLLEDPKCEAPGVPHDGGVDSVIPYEELQAWRHVPASAGAIFVVRTPVQFCDTMRKTVPAFDLDELLKADRVKLTDDGKLDCALSQPSGRAFTGPIETTRVPSLVELALRRAYHSSLLPELPGLLPADTFGTFCDLLHRTLAQRNEGGRHCSICGRLFVVPRTKWIEWWRPAGEAHIAPGVEDYCYNDVLPFIHFGCSTACTPRNLKRGTTLEQVRSGIDVLEG